MELAKEYRIKRTLKELETYTGSSTSMITLLLHPNDKLWLKVKMLNDEYSKSSNIKSRTNRLSVMSAIKSVLQKLKLYSTIPPNGLVIYCGNVIENNKVKKINVDFEPSISLNTSLYLCDNKFHVEDVLSLYASKDTYGYIIISGKMLLLAKVDQNIKICSKISVNLPNKNRKGGQSSVRFDRLCQEKRHNYLTKSNEEIINIFISNDLINVAGLIIAGPADLKNELIKLNSFDYRLKPYILDVIDIGYDGEIGLREAMKLSVNLLNGTNLHKEEEILSNFFTLLSNDSDMYCFGINDVRYCLEQNLIDTLIIDIDSKINNLITEEEDLLVDYLMDNCQILNFKVEFISNVTNTGKQFCKSFDGIGGILRYPFDLTIINNEDI